MEEYLNKINTLLTEARKDPYVSPEDYKALLDEVYNNVQVLLDEIENDFERGDF